MDDVGRCVGLEATVKIVVAVGPDPNRPNRLRVLLHCLVRGTRPAPWENLIERGPAISGQVAIRTERGVYCPVCGFGFPNRALHGAH